MKAAELLPKPVKPPVSSAARRGSESAAGTAAGASTSSEPEPQALAANNVVAMPGRLRITAEHRALLDQHFGHLAEMIRGPLRSKGPAQRDANNVVAMPSKLRITAEHRALLDQHVGHLAEMMRGPLRAKGTAQRDANKVFGLRRALHYPGQFEFYNLETQARDGPENPTGRYYFVVRVDEPNVVRLGDAELVHGHVSVARFPQRSIPEEEPAAPDVYYAGVMYFRGGRLLRVTNGSGHYLPPLERIENLTLWVKRMLEGADIRTGR